LRAGKPHSAAVEEVEEDFGGRTITVIRGVT
jgi:hypothetical protein